MARLLLLLLLVALSSCGDDSDPDAGPPLDAATDADRDATPPPVVFTAEADPAEELDCTEAPPPRGQSRAKHVVCARELVPGSIAMGIVGDLVLENARARFLIRGGQDSAATIGARSGAIVDAAPHGGDDLIKEVFPALGFTTMRPEAIVVAEAGDDGPARVRVLFEGEVIQFLSAAVGGLLTLVPARGVVDYELRPDEDALRVRMEITPVDGAPVAQGQPALIVMMGGVAEVWQPRGDVFMRQGTPGRDVGPLMVGEGPSSALAVRVLADEGAVSHIVSVNIVQAASRVVARPGETATWEGRVAVSPTAAMAWNAVHPEDGLAELEVEAAVTDRVEVALPTGEPVVRTRLDGTGRAAVRLPPGDYRVRAGWTTFFTGDAAAVTVDEAGAAIAPPRPKSAELEVDVRAAGEEEPVRVTLVDPFGNELAREVVLGPTRLRVPPGQYTVTASHGMEHDIHQQDVTLVDGETLPIAADLARLVDTTGWVAADFHLHTEMSTDSTFPVDHALRMMAAEGLDVVSSLDHDYINDYSLRADIAGVGDLLLTIQGTEISHGTVGHVGSYPARRSPVRAGAGSPVWFDLDHSQLFDAAREVGDESLGGAIVQLNHPRFGDDSFFDWLELDPETGMAGVTAEDLGLPPDADLDDFDFDAIEVWNMRPSGDDEEALVDYLGLFAAGRRFVMTGNSDCHEPTDRNAPGANRNYVRVPDDTRGAFLWEDVAASLRAGDVTVAGGIFVTAELAGEVVDGAVPVAVRVQAAPWVDVRRLRIHAGREVVVERSIDTGDVVRLDETIEVPLGGADFVVVRADGERETPPALSITPFGITNPLVVP